MDLHLFLMVHRLIFPFPEQLVQSNNDSDL
jgi:hypothetical protein